LHTDIDVVPYLAAERQLPVWDTQDCDDVKRNSVDNAWKVRKLSGTRAGLMLALNSFGFKSTITPWHKMSPTGTPYQLEIVAWEKDSKPIDGANAKKLLAYIEDTQSERDDVELSLMFCVETSASLAGARAPVINVNNTSSTAEIWSAPNPQLSLSITAAIPPSINIQPLKLKAVVPVIKGIGQMGISVVATHYSFTVSPVSAKAVLKGKEND